MNNFSFFNRAGPIQSAEELYKYLEALQRTRQDIAEGNLVYDPTKTYITFVVGDGDNTGMGFMGFITNSCQEMSSKLID